MMTKIRPHLDAAHVILTSLEENVISISSYRPFPFLDLDLSLKEAESPRESVGGLNC